MSVKMKCSCEFETNQAVIDKIRFKNANNQLMPEPAMIECDCGHTVTMTTLVYHCPQCLMTYGVTPCSAGDHNFIVKAGINY
jgi:Zn finger protein HypA/HybF involved in hydrogenase expression